jgi:hypothetical protein
MNLRDRRDAGYTRQLRRLQQRRRRELGTMRREVQALHGLLPAGMASTTDTSVPTAGIGSGERGSAGPGVAPGEERRDLRSFSDEGYGLYAASTHGTGAYCRSFGEGDGLSALSERGAGVTAMSLGPGDGLYAHSALGNGIHAVGGAALGNGQAPRPAAVFGEGGEGDGLYVTSTSGNGLVARSASGCAVDGCSAAGTGVLARAVDPGGIALAIEGRIRLHGCAIGEVCLPASEQTLTVAAAAAGVDSLILLVLLDDPGAALPIWIAARHAAHFVIRASAPPRSPVRLQYLIIN